MAVLPFFLLAAMCFFGRAIAAGVAVARRRRGQWATPEPSVKSLKCGPSGYLSYVVMLTIEEMVDMRCYQMLEHSARLTRS